MNDANFIENTTNTPLPANLEDKYVYKLLKKQIL